MLASIVVRAVRSWMRPARQMRILRWPLRRIWPAAALPVALVVAACGGASAIPATPPGGWTAAKTSDFRRGIADELTGELKGFTVGPLLESDMTKLEGCTVRAVERRYSPDSIPDDGASDAIQNDCKRELATYIHDAKALRDHIRATRGGG